MIGDFDGGVGSAGALEYTSDIELRHSLRRYMIVTAGVAYQYQDFDSVDLVEREVRLRAGVEYLFNREFALLAQYEHTRFSSTDANRDFQENLFSLGIRARR